VHIFTDLQTHEWQDQQIRAQSVGKNVHVYFHRVSTEPAKQPNVCLVQAKISSRRILPRQPYHVELLLRNDGDREMEVRVNMQEQEQTAADTTKVTIAAGAKQIVKLGFQAQTPGAHWIRTWIDGDGFAGDNRASLAYICEPTGDIAFIGGRTPADFGLLPLAFSPSGDGSDTSLVPGFRSLQELPALVDGKKPILAVLKWSAACALDKQTAERLGAYVRQGGHLLVLPAAAGAPASGNPPEWLGAGVEKLAVLAEDAPLAVPAGKSEFWADLRGTDGKVNFGGVYVRQYHPLALRGDAGYEPLLSVGDNKTVLAIRRLGEGQITVSGIAFAGKQEGVPEWSTLPTKKVFLVMVQPMALGAVSSLATRNMSIVAGNAPNSLPGQEAEVKITTLVGDQVDWSGPRDQVPVLVREGAYIVRVGKREICLSVMPSDTEGGTTFIDGAVVGAMGGIPYSVGDLTDSNKFSAEIARSVTGLELYIPLLLLAIVAFMAEGLVGSPSRWRSNRSAGEKEQGELPGQNAAVAAKSKVKAIS